MRGWRVPESTAAARLPVVAHHMEEHRRGEAHRIQPVEHAPVALDHVAPVLDAAVALDRRHHQAAPEPHQVDQQRQAEGLQWREWRDPPQRRAQRAGTQHAPHEALHRLRRRQLRCDQVPAQQLAPDVLQHVRGLHHDHQEGKQQHVARRVMSRHVQVQQQRDVRDAEHADHQPPLHLRRALQVVGGITADGRQDRQEQERVDRNQQRVPAVPVDPHQVVLPRQHDVERGQQRVVVARAGRRQGDELAQREQRDDREQHDHPGTAEEQRQPDHDRHHPPRADARDQVGDHRAGLPAPAPAQGLGHQCGQHQHRADTGKQQAGLLAYALRCQIAGDIQHETHARPPFGARSSSACRLRARKAVLSSSACSRSGVPKVAVHSSGNGRNRPLGITRFRLSIHTGTNSSSGRCRARW
ncbi:hypothetical protein G6F57_013931 [Rhizopus arrhizus]|nr:hypothetical protein G6F57_013931 [Rhizopus arrhizus]